MKKEDWKFAVAVAISVFTALGTAQMLWNHPGQIAMAIMLAAGLSQALMRVRATYKARRAMSV